MTDEFNKQAFLNETITMLNLKVILLIFASFLLILPLVVTLPSRNRENGKNCKYFKKQKFTTAKFLIVQKIIGGVGAALGEIPYQVSLQYFESDTETFKHICGGVILNEWYIRFPDLLAAILSTRFPWF